MSTNSRIGLRLADDSILSVYHHWDGYPEWLGVTLNEHYTNDLQVAKKSAIEWATDYGRAYVENRNLDTVFAVR